MKTTMKEKSLKALLSRLGEGAAIKISVYDKKYRNIRLSVEVNGESRPDLTIDPNRKLVDGYLFLNVADYPWLPDFLTNTRLGFYDNATYPKDGVDYPLFWVSLFTFRELDSEGYQAYQKLLNTKPKKNRWTNRDKTDDKGKYKTRTCDRKAFDNYHMKTEALVAYLPLGTRERISAIGEVPTVFFKKAVTDYLDYLEGGEHIG